MCSRPSPYPFYQAGSRIATIIECITDKTAWAASCTIVASRLNWALPLLLLSSPSPSSSGVGLDHYVGSWLDQPLSLTLPRRKVRQRWHHRHAKSSQVRTRSYRPWPFAAKPSKHSTHLPGDYANWAFYRAGMKLSFYSRTCGMVVVQQLANAPVV